MVIFWGAQTLVHSWLVKVKWVFPRIGVPQNGWFIMENPIKMDDLGVKVLSLSRDTCFPLLHAGLGSLQGNIELRGFLLQNWWEKPGGFFLGPNL